MKEALVSAGPKVQVIDSTIPVPEADQVVIKVVISGTNPKDWKRAENNEKALNTGDDIAGVVHTVGSDVTEFKTGDRVAAFHQMQAPHGSFAEYALSFAHTTFHLPKKTSFEEAATIPLAAMTSAFGLYQGLDLPLPWHPAKERLPLIIYGAASAVGSFAIQLAIQSNIHPLICVAGKSTSHVESLIDKSKGDQVLDYRVGNDQLVQSLAAAVKNAGGSIEHAFDCICEHGSYLNIAQVLNKETGKIAVILPLKDYSDIPKNITPIRTYVGGSQEETDTIYPSNKDTGTQVGNQDFAFAFFRYFGRGLLKGYFKGHPYEVVPGGLHGVEKALTDLKNGRASAVKYVLRLEDTEGVERYSTN
ncbi:putative secondary metabolism biosynthetic enzyme [Bacidia gigantensis]|uniref:putative secondary metabolism biosynthetic enzyme n=1 Tax=Bacidia gigantensis TaxID=2732470 RepID=UPI001D0454A3|nr:putative secondary metabolism biosynthetic enzyme [Bacidia gigantensis]KAG8525576.1 putative secondary metabolism biosynthetic enzyme [Bacidia gigantensis]